MVGGYVVFVVMVQLGLPLWAAVILSIAVRNEAPQRPEDSETQLARIKHRMARLCQIMQENRHRVDEERQELQTVVSDISHQVKTPVSNLKMATDTLLEKPMTCLLYTSRCV